MRILLVNYHYFSGGGPDTYFFNIKKALEDAGHVVVPFAFDYEETLPTEYRKYFPEPITGKGPSRLAQQRLTPKAKIKAIARMFRNPEVDRKFRQALREQRPDIVYAIYLSSSFLPNILKIAKEEFSIPVVYRLSDFHMFCASYLFFRDGGPCRDCETNLWSAVRHRCVHQSLVASLLRALQIKYVRLRKWYDAVDVFVCPSRWMQECLRKNGFPPRKVMHLPTFARDLGTGASSSDTPYILYLGKVIEEKGVEVLVKAFNHLKNPARRLALVGPVEPDYRERLLSLLDSEHRPLVSIDGPQYGERLADTIRGCEFAVQPALWYENMPNAVLEAMSAGKAVVASDIGSLPELVEHGKTGLLVPAGDVEALAAAMARLAQGDDLREMGELARRKFETRYTAEIHLGQLLRVFEGLLGSGSPTAK